MFAVERLLRFSGGYPAYPVDEGPDVGIAAVFAAVYHAVSDDSDAEPAERHDEFAAVNMPPGVDRGFQH
jgi:hypothetical protein